MHWVNIGKVFCLIGDGLTFAEVTFQEIGKCSPEMGLEFGLECIGEFMNTFGIFAKQPVIVNAMKLRDWDVDGLESSGLTGQFPH